MCIKILNLLWNHVNYCAHRKVTIFSLVNEIQKRSLWIISTIDYNINLTVLQSKLLGLTPFWKFYKYVYSSLTPALDVLDNFMKTLQQPQFLAYSNWKFTITFILCVFTLESPLMEAKSLTAQISHRPRVGKKFWKWMSLDFFTDVLRVNLVWKETNIFIQSYSNVNMTLKCYGIIYLLFCNSVSE